MKNRQVIEALHSERVVFNAVIYAKDDNSLGKHTNTARAATLTQCQKWDQSFMASLKDYLPG